MLRHVIGTTLVIAVLVAAFVLVYGIGWDALIHFIHLRALAFVLVGWGALLLVNQGWDGTAAFLRNLSGKELGSNVGAVAVFSEKVVIALAISAWIVAGTTYVVTYEDYSQIGAHLAFAWMATLYAAVLYLVSAAVVGRMRVVE